MMSNGARDPTDRPASNAASPSLDKEGLWTTAHQNGAGPAPAGPVTVQRCG
jgi:hypothetical protein